MKTVSFTLPQVTQPTPKAGTKYRTLNIDRSAPKLNSFAILSRTWVGSKTDARRLAYNNVFTSFGSAKAARAAILKALAENK